MNMQRKNFKNFEKLVEIMEKLRGENGCPWDRAQKREDLKTYLLEETYEVLDAIEKKDDEKLEEELGDLLLQIVFHCQIAKEEGKFDIENVARKINEKLIRRHPHVFGDLKVKTPEKVVINWEKIKKSENESGSVLDGVPKTLPALLKSYRLQEKAKRVGFDWEKIEDVEKKVMEEFRELKDAINSKDKDKIREEIGDLLFAIVNISRFLNIDPEDALQHSNEKFIRRFKEIESKAKEMGKELYSMTLEEMDILWEKVKKDERE